MEEVVEVARNAGVTEEHLPNLRTAMNNLIAQRVQQHLDQHAAGGQGLPPPAQQAPQDD